MKRPKSIEIGARFRPIGAVTKAPQKAWEIRKIFQSPVDNLTYVQLVCVDKPDLVKSIGLAALLDTKQFTSI